jgi:hypothetical protein
LFAARPACKATLAPMESFWKAALRLADRLSLHLTLTGSGIES